MMETILVVANERSENDFLRTFLEERGYIVISAYNLNEGIDYINNYKFDIVISNINIPATDELEVLRNAKRVSPNTKVIIISGSATIESEIEAKKCGVESYFRKPFKVEDIISEVKNIIELKKKLIENKQFIEMIETKYSFQGINVKSPIMQQLLKDISKIALSSSYVLIEGEIGSGRRLLAETIHKLSSSNNGELLSVHSTDELLEGKLFGFVKGSFPGALDDEKGLLEVANGGNIFIEEISELPSLIQSKLFIFAKYGVFRKVGGVTDIKTNVRIISSTNKKLRSLVDEGLFREDLFYSLNKLPIHIPSLRERKGDIPLLVSYFLNKISGNTKKVSPEAMKLLIDYPWKGNVRELENVIERIGLIIEKEEIIPVDLPEEITGYSGGKEHVPALNNEGINIDKIIGDIEKKYLLQALEITGDVKTEAAKLLNLSFRSFRHRLQKYGIK